MYNYDVRCKIDVRDGHELVWVTGEDLLNMLNPDACQAV